MLKWFSSPHEKKLLLLVVFICLMLVAKEYWATGEWMSQFAFRVFSLKGSPEHFHRMLGWASGCFLCYALLPWLFSRLVLKKNSAFAGLSLHVPKQHLKIYGLMLMVVAPAVFLASFNKHFQATYPFYFFPKSEFPSTRFLWWELFYLLQFVGVEYFFRGFILFHAKEFLGELAVYLSVIPYCMIHFGKPVPETIGAIFAGIFLGKMALRSGSIFPGIILHYTVALSMDLLSLWQQGYFAE